MNYFVKIK